MNAQPTTLETLLRDWPRRAEFAALWRSGAEPPSTALGARMVLRGLLRSGTAGSALEVLLREEDLEPARRLIEALERDPARVQEAVAGKQRLRQVERLRVLERDLERWTRDAGSTSAEVLVPVLAPSMPWSELPTTLLEWMLEPPERSDSPPGFAPGWVLDPADEPGRALAEALLSFLRDAPTREDALRLAHALARVLGAEPKPEDVTSAKSRVVRVPLVAHPLSLVSPELRLAGAQLIIPLEDADGEPPPGEDAIVLNPHRFTGFDSAGALHLTLDIIISCLPDVARRQVRIINELGRMLSLNNALHRCRITELNCLPQRSNAKNSDLKQRLLRLIHSLGIGVDNSAIELMQFLAGNVPFLAGNLIDSTIERISSERTRRYGPILRGDIHQVWLGSAGSQPSAGSSFDQAMQDWFGHLGHASLLEIFLLDARTAPSLDEMPFLTRDMLLENIDENDRKDINSGLSTLLESGLIEQDVRRDERVYRLSRTGPVWWKLRSLS